MKETKDLCALWKREVRWSRMTRKQKLTSVWFGLSFGLLCICGESLLVTLVVVANFATAAYHVVKNVPMEDE